MAKGLPSTTLSTVPRVELVETIVIILSVLALIPRALGFYRPWYGVVLVLVLVVMVAIAIRRLRRLSGPFRSDK